MIVLGVKDRHLHSSGVMFYFKKGPHPLVLLQSTDKNVILGNL